MKKVRELIKQLLLNNLSEELQHVKEQEMKLHCVTEQLELAQKELMQIKHQLNGCFRGHYTLWQEKRVTAIIEYYHPLWFKGKKILELGCGYGDIGAVFTALGADVTCSDAREEHLEVLKTKYPHIKTIKANIECEWPFEERYDLILHLGVLYHLNDINYSLERSINSADHVILETEVCDSDDHNTVIKIVEDKASYDQSFTGHGSRPSARYIEQFVEKYGASFERISGNECNSLFHQYNWEVQGSAEWRHGLRRFWYIKSPSAL